MTSTRQRRVAARVLASPVLLAIVVAPATNAFAAKGGGSTFTCHKSCTDTTPPTVAISSPSSGATVSGAVSVAGTAGDNVGLSSVAVAVDGGPWTTASGTTSWSYSLDTTSLSNSSHTVAAKATDKSGNTTTASESVTVQNGTASSSTTSSNGSITWSDTRVTNPSTGGALAPLGRGKQAEWGGISVVLCAVPYTSDKCVYLRDSSSGASSYVQLPVDTTAGWSNANYAMASASDLWISSGDGPIYVRHYRFSGSPLPTSATLVSSQTFGNTDSRHGDLTVLSSGGVVVVWHQQGSTGPQGQYVGYRAPSGAWQQLGPLQFMPTMASKQVVAQNPTDKSVWVFSDPDAWGAVGAIHLTESASGLAVDWTDGTFISSSQYGDFGADPENPDLAVAPDPSTGTVVLAYQDSHRYTFSNGTTGSYVAVARIATDATTTFTSLSTYVERISPLGLVVQPGKVWVAYRPVDPATLAYTDLYVDCYCNGGWLTGADLGTVASTSTRTGFGVSRSEVSAGMNDGALHLFTVS